MQFQISQLPMGARPNVKLPDPDFYRLLQEEGVRKLIHDHYECLRTSKIKNLFPAEADKFEQAKRNSADFFVQVLGGPKYYQQNRGKPKLADRHAPFKITLDARIEWLNCYRQVLGRLELPENIILSFWNYLDIFSLWMVNSEA